MQGEWPNPINQADARVIRRTRKGIMKTTLVKAALIGSIAATSLSSGVFAADLGVPRQPIATEVIAPVWTWTGIYAGAHVGYGWGRANWNFVQAGTFVSPSTNGVFGGAQIGYNYQIGSIVVGLEADASAADMSGWRSCPNPAFTCASRVNFLGSLRGRVGYAFDRALIYATAGLGVGNFRNRTYNAAPVTEFGSYSSTRAGLAVGAGVEYAFMPNWTVKAEYMYYHFGSGTQLAGVGSLAGPGGSDTRIRNDVHTVKLGLNYLFSTGPTAVAARY
jgi:outer membrane immunogenic protein